MEAESSRAYLPSQTSPFQRNLGEALMRQGNEVCLSSSKPAHQALSFTDSLLSRTVVLIHWQQKLGSCKRPQLSWHTPPITVALPLHPVNPGWPGSLLWSVKPGGSYNGSVKPGRSYNAWSPNLDLKGLYSFHSSLGKQGHVIAGGNKSARREILVEAVEI